MKHSASLLILAATALATVASLCSCDNGCEQTRENYIHACATSVSGRQMRSISFIMLSDSTVVGNFSVSSFDRFDVKVNPKSTATTLIMSCDYTDYGDRFSTTDTLVLNYETTPNFIDLSCGCTVTYHISHVSTTHNLVSNLVINNSEVLPESGIHLTIEY